MPYNPADGEKRESSRWACGPSASPTGSGQSDVVLADAAAEQIRTHARLTAPLECCGLLLGEGAAITDARPARNVHLSPQTHFEIDPQTLIDAHRAARAGGPQVLGYYHSHPRGPAQPSATDRAMAARDRAIWAIVAGDQITLWRDDESCFTPLSYRLATG
ncbi:M67 family peptidase [Aurantiacibacter xanthus]|uniref:M67 family peptidase n=2 Tax=Aurantiacibacter xanthus TaxID=1784712 RepID=A0A3A1P2I4_9SPHN|nr:M67 family peptidase [Aurantiacibacter xanthus]